MTHSAGTLVELLSVGIKSVSSLHDATCDLAHPGSPSATVIMMRRVNDTLEWLVLADSVLLLDVVEAADPMVICDSAGLTLASQKTFDDATALYCRR